MHTNRSHFAHINGQRIHYTIDGNGDPAFVLLHGSFLNLFSWRGVVEPLAARGTVIAFDRIAFGESARPLLPPSQNRLAPPNPYLPEAQADLTIGLMDHLGIDRAILIGNSTGGTFALLAALRHPERVQALVMVSSMVYSGYPVSEIPGWVRPLLPHRLGPWLIQRIFQRVFDNMIRSFWHDPARLTPEVLAVYRSLLSKDHWATALWELILATHRLHLETAIKHLDVPTLVVTGEQDRTVPTRESIRLAEELPDAGLMVLPECGHLAHEECPERFLDALTWFLDRREA